MVLAGNIRTQINALATGGDASPASVLDNVAVEAVQSAPTLAGLDTLQGIVGSPSAAQGVNRAARSLLPGYASITENFNIGGLLSSAVPALRLALPSVTISVTPSTPPGIPAGSLLIGSQVLNGRVVQSFRLADGNLRWWAAPTARPWSQTRPWARSPMWTATGM
jgi:hypothetical protein